MKNCRLLVFVSLQVILLVKLATATPIVEQNRLQPVLERSETIYRLPSGVTPHHYIINIAPLFTLGKTGFIGRVSFNFTLANPTNVIILHADRLDIDPAETRIMSTPDFNTVSPAFWNYDPLRQFYLISFSSNLPNGTYIASLTYTGQYANDMYGLYRSSYRDGNRTRWLVTSQFKPTGARRAFPCFDEPGLKATFDISIAHFQDQIALSNTQNVSTSQPDIAVGGRVWTRFETTPVMSTHLLIFTVSDFGVFGGPDSNYNIYTRPGAVDSAEWAFNATTAMHPIFMNEIATPDPSPKVDKIAIPDLVAGSMSNWGLFTYRERNLLWNQGVSSSSDQEAIVTTISHELAHIWFGNLVTPVWWNHLWFSEGFASFYQYRIPSLIYPLWRFAERIVTDQQLPALIGDSLETTRALTNNPGSRESVMSSFDSVAFRKGAAVVRMLNRVMREDLFTRALGTYFAEASFGTFNPDDLWRHMQAIADPGTPFHNHTSVATIMDTWINQAGFPLVTVTRNYSTTLASISQERFFMNPDSPTADPESQRWWIPITFAMGNTLANTRRCNGGWIRPDWLRAQDKTILVSGFVNTTWVIVNCQAIGFYRTNYDTRNWELLTEFLNSSEFAEINAINRAVLIDDSLNLARAGYIDYSIPLNLISYLRQERDFVVWRAAIPAINYVSAMIGGDDVYFRAWNSFLIDLVYDVYHSLGLYPGAADSHVIRVHRERIFDFACRVDVPGARAEAEMRFNRWVADPVQNTLLPDVKPIIYCWGIKSASEEVWDRVWNYYLTTDIPSEANVLLRSLACTENSTIVEKYLRLTITTNSGIRMQDALMVFTSLLYRGPKNVDTAIKFVQDNTAAIADLYGGFALLDTMLGKIAGRISSKDQMAKFITVVNSTDFGTSQEAIRRTLRRATANLYWVDYRAPVIHNWLRDQGFVIETTTETTTPTTEATTTTTVPTTTTVQTTTIATEAPTPIATEAPTPIATEAPTTPTPGNGAVTFTSSLFAIFTCTLVTLSRHLTA